MARTLQVKNICWNNTWKQNDKMNMCGIRNNIRNFSDDVGFIDDIYYYVKVSGNKSINKD